MNCLLDFSTLNYLKISQLFARPASPRTKPASPKPAQTSKLASFVPLNDQKLLKLYRAIDLSG